MIKAEQQRDWAQQLLAASAAELTAVQPDWMSAARAAAVQTLSTLPLLDRKQEAWRYTRIDALLEHRFLPATAAPAVPTTILNSCLLPAFDAWRLVFANGRFMPWLSNLHDLPAGVQLCSLREALTTNPEQLATWFGQAVQQPGHVFTALNTALVNDGVYLHIENGVELEQPIEVIYINQCADAPLLLQPRNLVILEPAAKATLIERFISPDESLYFHNNLSEIVLGAGAALSHYRMQDESRSAYHLGSLYLSQQRDSRYHGTSLAFGGRWARTRWISCAFGIDRANGRSSMWRRGQTRAAMRGRSGSSAARRAGASRAATRRCRISTPKPRPCSRHFRRIIGRPRSAAFWINTRASFRR